MRLFANSTDQRIFKSRVQKTPFVNNNKQEQPTKSRMLVEPTRTQDITPPHPISVKEQPIMDTAQKTASENINFSIGQDELTTKRREGGGMSEGQLREFFSRVRAEVEKVLNEEEMSVQFFEILPADLESDFLELISSVRNRIAELTDKLQQQQLSFLYIDQQEEVYFGDSLIEEFPEFAPAVDPKQILTLRQKIEEQEKTIQNLATEKEQHELTVSQWVTQINQLAQEKEEIDEEIETRFITQLSVLKTELKEFKDRIDTLDILLSTTKTTMFKVLEIVFSEDTTLEIDLAEALNYYMEVVSVSDKEQHLLNAYFGQYTQRNKHKPKKSWFRG